MTNYRSMCSNMCCIEICTHWCRVICYCTSKFAPPAAYIVVIIIINIMVDHKICSYHIGIFKSSSHLLLGRPTSLCPIGLYSTALRAVLYRYNRWMWPCLSFFVSVILSFILNICNSLRIVRLVGHPFWCTQQHVLKISTKILPWQLAF
jgi:hypothetical protein